VTQMKPADGWLNFVIPAKAGIQSRHTLDKRSLDPRFRADDGNILLRLVATLILGAALSL